MISDINIWTDAIGNVNNGHYNFVLKFIRLDFTNPLIPFYEN